MKCRQLRGFALVELLVVITALAIVAAITIPVISGNHRRAIIAEGSGGLVMVRGALRDRFGRTGSYGSAGEGTAVTSIEGLRASALDRRFFKANDYTYTAFGSTFTVSVNGGAHSRVAGVRMTMNQDGVFSSTGL